MIIDFLLGEKDPRCLLLALKTLNRKLEGLKEGGWEEEVLEAVMVYYPITFEPPPGDRRGVSNESLRRELNECLRKVGGVKVCLERCEEEGEDEKVKGLKDLRVVIGSSLPPYASDVRDCLLQCQESFFRDNVKSCVLDIITDVARKIETEDNEIWRKEFVEGSVRYLKGSVSENPESVNGRSAVEFLASVTKGGGKNAGIVLKGVAEDLLDMCVSDDEKRASAAATGLGLIFAGTKSDLIVSPNPISPYSDAAVLAFNKLTSSNQVAGVIAMMSLFCCPPESVVELNVVEEYSRSIFGKIVEGEAADDFLKASSICLGNILGLEIYSPVTTRMLPQLIERSLNGNCGHSLTAISKACGNSRGVTRVVLPEIFKKVCEGLGEAGEGGKDGSRALVELVKEGGKNVVENFGGGEGGEEGVELLSIVKSLCSILPDSDLEEKRVAAGLEAVPNLIEVFKIVVRPNAELPAIVNYFENIIKEDDALNRKRLNVSLPLFTASLTKLEGGGGDMNEGDWTELNDALVGLVKPLCKISRNLTYCLDVRTAASEGLMRIVKGSTTVQASFLKEVVKEIVETLKSFKDIETLGNDVRLLARIGAAAACKGGAEGEVADEVVRVLCGMCCDSEGNDLKVRVVGGEGLGEFIRSEGGGPFWRQRAASIALPEIMESIEAGLEGTEENSSDYQKCFGSIIAAGHFAQSLPVKVVSKGGVSSKSLNLVQCLMAGLVLAEKRKGMGEPWEAGAWEVVINSAMLSFQRLTSAGGEDMAVFEGYYETLLPTLLHFSLRNSYSVDGNVLALDCLKNIAANGTFAKIKKSLILINHRLGLVLGHPRREVRMKAVEVRNIFILLDRKN
ncbi:hypothetical protein TrST_g4416 [Triparma strigata]|uniref:MMS19 nucleotide excision repair protein n=1 Tax=Triparma strigata TaxID=1606541 RepID=A0A9W7BUV5_9STRA|nr:hypothetical protein TrST_g4416 [Triparma strigata]